MKRVLLANPIGPYELGWGEDMFDLFGARLTRGQGVFTLGGHLHAWALYLIAENIPAYSTVLEYPDETIFKKELKKGYDYVAIQIKTIHTENVKKMMEMVKEVSPESKIVIGGYGVMLLYNPPPNDPDNLAGYIIDNADYICYEEGVGFFRKILGADVNEPITQFHAPLCGATLRGFEKILQFRASGILVALGCPNGCEFCTTSAYFKQKKIQVATPEQCFNYLKAAHERIGSKASIFNMIWDEDFLLNKPYIMRLGELIQKADMVDRFNFFCFASIKALSQYTAEELSSCGIGAVWIGFESKYDEVITSEHNIQKRAGRDIGEVFDDLHRHGIIVISSNILGWDFHTRDNIEEDIDYFVSLKPDLYQVSPLTPCPGTPLYGRMKEQGRVYEDFTWKDLHLWKDDVFKVKNFERDEMRQYYNQCHKKLFEINGPSILNVAHVMLQGYRTLLHSPNPHLQKRADRFYYFARKLGPAILYSLRKFAPGEAVANRVNELERLHVQFIGKLNLLEKFAGRFIVYPLIKHMKKKTEKPGYQNKSDPPWRITSYSGDKSAPVIVKRRNPIKFRQERIQRSVAESFLGIKHKSTNKIRRVDIDDYPYRCKAIDIEGNVMSYVDEGKGETLLMLHGNPTWSYLYRHFIRELKDNYRCIALDSLGYGLSDKPADGDYSMDAHIRRLGKFIEQTGLKDITLICQDWGGIIGLSYAARNKDKFKRLIPMNTTGFLPGSISEFFKCSLGAYAFPYLWSFKIPILGKMMGMNWNIFLNAGLRMGIYNSKRQLHEKAMAGYLYPHQRVKDRIAILKSVRQIPILPAGPIWRLLKSTGELLKGWDIRTQVIWGAKDPVFVSWFADKFEEILPNHAQTLKIPTASHFLQDDEPEIIVNKIKEFLSERVVKKKSKTAKPVSA